MNTRTKTLIMLVLLVLLVAVLALLANVHLFEDGSWAIGSFPYPVSGCLPWGICN